MECEFNPFKHGGGFIDGEWLSLTKLGNSIEVFNPCNEKLVGKLATVSSDQTRSAIDSAESGLVRWCNYNNWERAEILHKIALTMREVSKQAAEILANELGKPLAQGEREWNMGIDQFEWYGDEARKLEGKVIHSRIDNCYYEIIQEPVGIVAAFTAWNFPPLLSSRKIAPALAAGCSIILRPSDEAPSAVMLLVECCRLAGVPKGVVNLVIGSIADTYKILVADDRVRKMSLTGSTAVGKTMIKESADTVKRLSMELGGNAPVIVFDDVDVLSVATQASASKHANAGQVCASPDRFYIHTNIYDEFVEAYTAEVKKIKIGDSFAPDTTMGPLVSSKQLEAVDELVKSSIAQGAKLILGGAKYGNKGYYYQPTILKDVKDTYQCSCFENFGPISAFSSFDDEAEVITRANNSVYGLASYVFTKDKSRLKRLVSAIEAGMVAANTFALVSAQMPFGGIKHSGFGGEGGTDTIKDYCNTKVVHYFNGD